MKERAVLVQNDPALVGIVTEAETPTSGPGVVILNAGVVHRVGPNRLHVRLGRALAAIGFPVLRFDLSGIGDSDVRRDHLSFVDSAPLETREAMSYLTRTAGVQQFVVAGICSGAGTAFRVAASDPRVAGVILIEPYAFP